MVYILCLQANVHKISSAIYLVTVSEELKVLRVARVDIKCIALGWEHGTN